MSLNEGMTNTWPAPDPATIASTLVVIEPVGDGWLRILERIVDYPAIMAVVDKVMVHPDCDDRGAVYPTYSRIGDDINLSWCNFEVAFRVRGDQAWCYYHDVPADCVTADGKILACN